MACPRARRPRHHRESVAFVLLDQDLVRHDRAEVGVEYEISLIYPALGQQVPLPDQSRVKAPDNYVGRILATIFSFGIYMFWWSPGRRRPVDRRASLVDRRR
jgi:hypothetical protein